MWRMDSDEDIVELLCSKVFSFGHDRNYREFIALIRAKLMSLFGHSSPLNGGYQKSFFYEIKAIIGDETLCFQVCDRNAEDVLIYWGSLLSSRQLKGQVKEAFIELLLQVDPSDFEDEFLCEDDYWIAYGYCQGQPWAEVELGLNARRLLFQSSFGCIQQSHAKFEKYLSEMFQEVLQENSMCLAK